MQLPAAIDVAQTLASAGYVTHLTIDAHGATVHVTDAQLGRQRLERLAGIADDHNLELVYRRESGLHLIAR